MSDLMEKAESKPFRQLAKDEDQAEEQLQKELEELGFRTIGDFSDKNEQRKDNQLQYELSEMEKRKLQGIFGEKITIFIEGKIKRFLRERLPRDWELKNNIRLKTDGNEKSLKFGEAPSDRDSITITGTNISHHGVEEEALVERVQSKHFACTDYLFEKFQEYQIPTIDNILYAVKKAGQQKTFEYQVTDHSTNSAQLTQERKKIEIDRIDDFKIIGLEVKTSESKPGKLLSSKQREVRDKAKESAFLDLYTVKVDFDYSTGKLPQNVPVEIRKISGITE